MKKPSITSGYVSKKYADPIAIVADLHLGPRYRSALRLWRQTVVEDMMLYSFFRFLDQLEALEISTLVIAGDLFDRSIIAPSMIRALKERLDSADLMVYALAGNHDFSKFDGLALDYLGSPYFHPRSEPMVYDTGTGAPLLFVPYLKGESLESTITKLIVEAPNACTLIGHFGIFDRESPSWSKYDPWSIRVDRLHELLVDTSVKFVLCGHYHTQALWLYGEDCVYARIGALSPCNFGEPGFSFGHYFVLDNQEIQLSLVQQAIPGVRYVNTYDDLPNEHNATTDCSWIISRLPYDDIVKARPRVFLGQHKIVDEPTEVNDVLGGAITYLPEPTIKSLSPGVAGRIGPEGENRDQVMQEYMKRADMDLALAPVARSFLGKSTLVCRPPRSHLERLHDRKY